MTEGQTYPNNPTTAAMYNDIEGGQTNYEDIFVKNLVQFYKRNKFVQKVFCNLTVMLTLTGLSCYAFMTHPNLKELLSHGEGFIFNMYVGHFCWHNICYYLL